MQLFRCDDARGERPHARQRLAGRVGDVERRGAAVARAAEAHAQGRSPDGAQRDAAPGERERDLGRRLEVVQDERVQRCVQERRVQRELPGRSCAGVRELELGKQLIAAPVDGAQSAKVRAVVEPRAGQLRVAAVDRDRRGAGRRPGAQLEVEGRGGRPARGQPRARVPAPRRVRRRVLGAGVERERALAGRVHGTER